MDEAEEIENPGLLLMQRLSKKRRLESSFSIILSEPFPDTNTLHYLIQRDRNKLYVYDQQGHLPVHIAALSGNLRFILMIYEIDRDLLCKSTKDGRHSCLSLAVKSGRTEVARFLLQSFPHQATFEAEKGCPIHVAILEKRNEIIKDVLKYAPDTVNIAKGDGRYAIHLAATRTPAQVKLMLDFDRNQLDKQDSDGNYPQHFAAICGAVESLKEIFKYLPNGEAIDRCLLAVNQTRCTPLYMASSSGHVEMVRFLLDSCPDSAYVPAAKDTYPIHIACQQRHYAVVKLLLERSPDSAKFSRNDRLLPLNMTVRDLNTPPPLDLLKLLIRAYPEAIYNQNIDGLTVLQVLRRTKYTSNVNSNPRLSSILSGQNAITNGSEQKGSRILPTMQIRFIVNRFPHLDEKLYRELNWYMRKLAALLSYPELRSQFTGQQGELNIFARIKLANTDVWRHILTFI
jgi:ankyrin repeat protein